MEARVVSDYVVIKLPVDELVHAFNFKEDNSKKTIKKLTK